MRKAALRLLLIVLGSAQKKAGKGAGDAELDELLSKQETKVRVRCTCHCRSADLTLH